MFNTAFVIRRSIAIALADAKYLSVLIPILHKYDFHKSHIYTLYPPHPLRHTMLNADSKPRGDCKSCEFVFVFANGHIHIQRIILIRLSFIPVPCRRRDAFLCHHISSIRLCQIGFGSSTN